MENDFKTQIEEMLKSSDHSDAALEQAYKDKIKQIIRLVFFDFFSYLVANEQKDVTKEIVDNWVNQYVEETYKRDKDEKPQ